MTFSRRLVERFKYFPERFKHSVKKARFANLIAIISKPKALQFRFRSSSEAASSSRHSRVLHLPARAQAMIKFRETDRTFVIYCGIARIYPTDERLWQLNIYWSYSEACTGSFSRNIITRGTKLYRKLIRDCKLSTCQTDLKAKLSYTCQTDLKAKLSYTCQTDLKAKLSYTCQTDLKAKLSYTCQTDLKAKLSYTCQTDLKAKLSYTFPSYFGLFEITDIKKIDSKKSERRFDRSSVIIKFNLKNKS